MGEWASADPDILGRPAAEPEPEFDDVRTRRISPLRVMLVVFGISLGVGAWFMYDVYADESEAGNEIQAWTAPYVDVTVTPRFAFEDVSQDVQDVMLAFVVAHRDDPCTPAWGGQFDLDEAADELELDRRIARLRQTGKDVLVSFGGAINDELAVACTDGEQLASAYLDVVERYDVNTIDLDIEGEALADAGSFERRAEAIATVQAQRSAAGEDLAVWLTMPTTPSGLTQEGVAVLESMVAADVDVGGVNLMTMNFGESRGVSSMLEASQSALEGATVQVLGVWRRAGLEISPAEAKARLGATPMIGRNDIVSDVFTLDHAHALTDLINDEGFGRISYWSLNRDRPCAPNEEPIATASNHCSHEEQLDLSFASVFSALEGTAAEAAGVDLGLFTFDLLEDDPERSPYPIWEPNVVFEGGSKAVLHGYVYEAKWWTRDDNPEAAVLNEWDTPWKLIGPVLPEDLVERAPAPRSAAPAWDGTAIYEAGDRVWIDGVVYEAKWWNEGFQPNRVVVDHNENPWEALDSDEFSD